MARHEGRMRADWLGKTQGIGRTNETNAGQVWRENVKGKSKRGGWEGHRRKTKCEPKRSNMLTFYTSTQTSEINKNVIILDICGTSTFCPPKKIPFNLPMTIDRQ